MSYRQNLTNQTFGRLTAIYRTRTRAGMCGWFCKCACGGTTTVATQHLTGGKTRSCGCLKREMSTARATKHGLARSPEYRVWSAMKDRCLNPKIKSYRNYGARGITVCQEWKDGFAAFIRDMGARPSPTATIERNDNNGPYSPDNCRWATRHEQGRNKRGNRWVEWHGKRLIISDWATVVGIHKDALRHRLDIGWSTERAFTTPSKNHG